MVSLSRQIKLWRICYELVCWISKVVGFSTYLRLSLLTTTDIRRLLECCRMKHFMDVSVSHPYIGTTLGPELIQDMRDKVFVIRERMSVAQSRQKSDADNRRRPSKFEVRDHVFLTISPMRGVMRFGKKGKLSP